MRDEKHRLSSDIRRWARAVGFDLVGIAPAKRDLGWDRLQPWLQQGRQGEMRFLEASIPARRDPSLILEGVKSVVMVGLVYRTKDPEPAKEGEGRISRYAWGEDYHEVIRAKLKSVGEKMRSEYPHVNSRRAVDSAPIMERDYARLAGLGWIGKNTLLLNRQKGSWFFLGALLVDVELDYDRPAATDHCGSCQRCLEACPTGAFVGPYELDARRCISYLTIEHYSTVDPTLAEKMNGWIYGCDICQEVCPWNETAPRRSRHGEPLFLPHDGRDPASLQAMLRLTPETFAEQFSGTAIFRSGRDRLVRSAIIAAVQQRAKGCREEIERLATDGSAVVRETAQWGLTVWTTSPEGRSGSEAVVS